MKEYYSIIEISRLINRSRNFVKNAIKYLNIQGKIIYCNKARKKIIAYSDEEMKQIKLLNEETKNDPHYLNKQTNLKKYGVEHPFQNEDIQEKSKMSCLNKYGVSNYNQTEIAQSIRKRTMLKKYGVENPSQSEEIKDKKRKTNERKLEFAKSQNLHDIKELSFIFHKNETTITDVINKLNIDSHIEKDSRVYVKSSDLSILEDYFSKTEMSGTSYSEKEIVNFIKSICNYEIIENSKKIIYPKELDIYIPSKNLAIEYDGLYWHDENHVETNYHLNKTIACNNKGIDLIHVFEDDWINRKEIVKSMIASRIGVYQQKIFARKCEVKRIEKLQAETFFNENHLQGFANGDLYLALIYNGEIVQCICINKKGWHDGNVELTRMATKLNIQVVGGFSKLMKHVSDYIDYNSITSYIYKAWFNGKGYAESGFEVIKENPPSYTYVINEGRIHKSYFRKNKIKRYFENKLIDYYNENETEHENMKHNYIYRIYDCGTIKVNYNRIN